ncbi:trypsin-like peptidase domain-containing protein [Alienimonas californiensis]|uniref:Putative periplasmic serine endoprotease DegP-like n=1 Tax=Alienimonas californiensis TaxID=2527989 RepID=A0A517P5W7_9PLAN|nr:trypsin-like peptidase domain-containing protein [Alienimonas californiensis]QDT14771.1 putative periplasmic serine endoprotease DegP-like precursor [Alienimonas californiensis]
MPVTKHTRGLVPAALAGLLAAGGTAAALTAGAAPPLVPAVAAVGTNATAADARELSGVFRTVAEQVMPAVVAVEARVEAPAAAAPQVRQFRGQLPPGVNPEGFDPFTDPQFRRFFEDSFPGRELPEGFRFERNQLRGAPRGAIRVKSGSGAVIDPAGLILTNNHVVEGASEVTVRFENGDEYTTSDILTDPDTDVALLRLNPKDLGDRKLPSVQLADSSRTQIGDWVLAFGSPLNQQFSMTAGIVSGKSRTSGLAERENFLQHDAAINPGSSGGPLVNLDGQIVGVNTAISSRGGGYDGISFAVPSSDAEWVVNQLAEKGSVTRAFLGVYMQPLDPSAAEALGVPTDAGVLVADVIQGSPAEAAGVEEGDVIVSLDGRDVSDPRQLSRLVERLEIGKEVPLNVIRDGGRRTLQLKAANLSEAPQQTARRESRPSRDGDGDAEIGEVFQLDAFGLALAPLSDEWRDRLGLEETATGAVVVAVKGPARAAGLRPGQLVERLGRHELASADDLQAAIDAVDEDKPLLALVSDPRGGNSSFRTLRPDAERPDAEDSDAEREE